ncbi:unnamed protein product [Paramecium sonneborni]|uniref:Histidine acid phosphatase family protein n=1 Tax=Paramecium sonneborni TaxID=65129 RepID=A0A8S1LQ75_9CILI|nr:unnamed protein product [Paramecium sonneborni]
MIHILSLVISTAMAFQSILIMRHGARDPHTWTEIDRNFLWIVDPTILTEKGVKQLVQLGINQQRLDIFDSFGNCIYEQLELQSSKSARCTSSLVCFIKGLCPQNYADILHRLFQEQYQPYVTNQTAFEEIMNSNFEDPLELNFEAFDKPLDFMFQGQKKNTCPNVQTVNKAVQSSTQYKKKEKELLSREEFNKVYYWIQEANPSTVIDKSKLNLNDVDEFYDDYFCNSFEGFNFPDPDQDTQNYLNEVEQFLKYFGANSEPLQHYAGVSEPFRWIIQQLDSNQSLSVYSGTETNQMAILSVLTDQQYLTPFASQLELVIQGQRVYIYYNKQFINASYCESDFYCTKQELINYLSKYVVNNLNELCNSNEQ